MARQPQAVSDAASDQNFRAIADDTAAIEGRLDALDFEESASGTAEAEFEAEKSFSKEVTVNHGLGGTPTAVHLTASIGGGYFASVTGVTSTQFKFIAYNFIGAPGAGVKASFYWTALR